MNENLSYDRLTRLSDHHAQRTALLKTRYGICFDVNCTLVLPLILLVELIQKINGPYLMAIRGIKDVYLCRGHTLKVRNPAGYLNKPGFVQPEFHILSDIVP